ncbi:NUDIX hydrolase [Psychrobacter sp. Sarcosine-02u-2]|uniref:NUDIX domain-containing protein n=1 Tax=Psychrobacter sp. Sarcosine-02u-2 TaxID=2058324 RepID=UPI000C7E2F1D|nr:NUDIX domain-containing protein [Psychrobacter sp. Sarcosine-02u-2]PKG84333.1 NUDIX hydrolase [Psychrobacter sp. Sarcosine-02u-2]
MSSYLENSSKNSFAKNEARAHKPLKIVNVAVAVIYYQHQYLLGFRNASQHQGNRYEFVGGKIDANETAQQALIREVAEETGIDIANNTAVKLGRLHHDYGDKQVCLQVYKVALSAQQYEQHRHCQQGLEGQALTWVDKSKLLAGDYQLPAANKTILAWLRLPQQIAITYPLAHFNDAADPAATWLQFHAAHLAHDAWVYVRPKAMDADNNIAQLLRLRADIQAIVPAEFESDQAHKQAINHQIVAKQLTQTQLIRGLSDINNDVHQSKNAIHDGLLNYPLIVSCHDVESVAAANKLAHRRLEQQLSPVIGIFLSPVLATQTHPDVEPLGWQAWSILAELADIPVIGLGGLSPAMRAQAEQYGGIAVAGISQFLR